MVNTIKRVQAGTASAQVHNVEPANGASYVEDLYRAHAKTMMAAARRILDDEDAASDAVHIVFSRLLLLNSQENSITLGYLLRAVQNEAFCLHRNATRARRNLERYAVELETRTHPLETSTDAAPVRAPTQIASVIINGLPLRQRKILTMRLKGLHNAQIASKLGITVKAVEYHCTKAFRYLRATLPRHDVHTAHRGGDSD